MVERFLLRNNPTFFQSASLLRTREWSVFYLQNTSATRLTVRSTKKVASLSVDRHKMVRRVREAWQSIVKDTSKNFSLVIFPTRKTIDVSFEFLQKAAVETLQRLY